MHYVNELRQDKNMCVCISIEIVMETSRAKLLQ